MLKAAAKNVVSFTKVASPGSPGNAKLSWRWLTVLLVSVTVISHTRWNAAEAQL
jgi:hypothetical protein